MTRAPWLPPRPSGVHPAPACPTLPSWPPSPSDLACALAPFQGKVGAPGAHSQIHIQYYPCPRRPHSGSRTAQPLGQPPAAPLTPAGSDTLPGAASESGCLARPSKPAKAADRFSTSAMSETAEGWASTARESDDDTHRAPLARTKSWSALVRQRLGRSPSGCPGTVQGPTPPPAEAPATPAPPPARTGPEGRRKSFSLAVGLRHGTTMPPQSPARGGRVARPS